MRVALLNLMPEKIKTETQLTRLIGATPLQVEMTLVTTSSYTPRNTSADHLLAFYRSWESVRHRNFDGLIITGAPVETMPFEHVQYWQELTQILDWSQTHVQETLNPLLGRASFALSLPQGPKARSSTEDVRRFPASNRHTQHDFCGALMMCSRSPSAAIRRHARKTSIRYLTCMCWQPPRRLALHSPRPCAPAAGYAQPPRV